MCLTMIMGKSRVKLGYDYSNQKQQFMTSIIIFRWCDYGIISLIQLDTNVVKTYALPQMWGKQAASEKLGIVSTSSNEVQSWLAMPKLWWCQAIWCDQWFKLAQTSSAARRGSLYALSPCWSLTQHKRFRKLCSELGHVIDVAEGYEKKIAKGKNCLTWH